MRKLKILIVLIIHCETTAVESINPSRSVDDVFVRLQAENWAMQYIRFVADLV